MIKAFSYQSAVPGSSAIALMDTTNRNLTRIEGLIGSPPVRSAVTPLAGRHGATDATRYYDDRMITIEGSLWNTSTSAVLADFATLSASFAESLYAPATITFKRADDTEFFAKVKLAGEVLPSLEGNGQILNYQATFRAADPRFYSTTPVSVNLASITTTNPTGSPWTAPQTSASVNVTNSGNVPTPFILTMNVTTSGGIPTGSFEPPYMKADVYAPSGYFSSPTSSQFANNLPSTGHGAIRGASSVTISGSASSGFFYDGGYAGSSHTFDTGSRSSSWISAASVGVAYDSDYPLLYPGTNTMTWTGYVSPGYNLSSVSMTVSFYPAYL